MLSVSFIIKTLRCIITSILSRNNSIWTSQKGLLIKYFMRSSERRLLPKANNKISYFLEMHLFLMFLSLLGFQHANC